MLDRFAIASMLRELALLFSLEGENKFKVRAYERGAEALERLEEDLAVLVEEDRLTDIGAIGPHLAHVIREIIRTGAAKDLDRLRRKIPRGVVELHRVEGLSEKRIRSLHDRLGVDSVEKLRDVLASGRVRELKGFGPKVEQKIREALARHEAGAEKMRLLDALQAGRRLVRHMKLVSPSVEEASTLRRRHEVVE